MRREKGRQRQGKRKGRMSGEMREERWREKRIELTKGQIEDFVVKMSTKILGIDICTWRSI